MELLLQALLWILKIAQWAIFVRVIISWLPIPKNSPIITALYYITEPILAPIRSMLSKSAMGQNMMFDLSPIIAFLLIGILQNVIIGLF